MEAKKKEPQETFRTVGIEHVHNGDTIRVLISNARGKREELVTGVLEGEPWAKACESKLRCDCQPHVKDTIFVTPHGKKPKEVTLTHRMVLQRSP